MSTRDFGDGLSWHKATRSDSNGGHCVYVAHTGDQVGVRDSKEGPAGVPAWFAPAAWGAFLDGVKAGEFNI